MGLGYDDSGDRIFSGGVWIGHDIDIDLVISGFHLIGGIPTPLKNDGVRQIGSSSQRLEKIQVMFQSPPTRLLSDLSIIHGY